MSKNPKPSYEELEAELAQAKESLRLAELLTQPVRAASDARADRLEERPR